jgi:hypothetical protein
VWPGREDGCQIGRVLVDNDFSAGTVFNKPRPEFDVMVQAYVPARMS